MFDESSFLVHHGVKGMRWGVWNDETRRKYLRSHRKTLSKGTKLKRITNAKEAENPDLSRSMYATKNKQSYDAYFNLDLPATSDEKVASVMNMKLSKDAVYADAETSIALALEESLGKTLSQLQKEGVSKTVRNDREGKDLYEDFERFTKAYIEKYGDERVSKVLKTRLSDADSNKMEIANGLIWFAVSGTVGSYAKKKNQVEYRDRMKKYGFDIIVDPEDETDNFNRHTEKIKDPLILLDPSKIIDPDEIRVTKRKLN